METNNLIDLIKRNDENAFKELLEQFTKMIHAIIKEYDLDYGDYQVSKDDLYQEATIALYEAAINFDQSKDNKFSTFAFMVIKRRVARFYKRYRSDYEMASCSIDMIELQDHNLIFKSNAVNDNPIEYHKRLDFIEALRNDNSKITSEDKTILIMRMNNYSYSEIAKKLGVNTKRIDNRIARLKKIYLNNNSDK